MWWHAGDSKDRKSLNAPNVIMLQIKKVTLGDIVALDTVILFWLQRIAAQRSWSSWTQETCLMWSRGHISETFGQFSLSEEADKTYTSSGLFINIDIHGMP